MFLINVMKSTVNTPVTGRPPSQSFQDYIAKIQWFLWPVYEEERSKILPMTAVFFCVSFIYNILGALKKTILLSSPCIKAQAVSYLKIFAIMPAAVIFTLMTTTLQTRYGQKRALQYMITFFGFSFAVITLIIYPNRDLLVLNLPGDFELSNLINNWDITLFYIFAEMWSSIILNVLCWGIIIETTHLKQSKRIYAIFTAAANIATLFAGWWAAKALDQQLIWFYGGPIGDLTWYHRLIFQMSVVWLLQFIIIGLLQFANTQPLSDKENTHASNTAQKSKKSKHKVGIIEAIRITCSNPILRSIALIMISYNMIYHLSDVTHSAYVKATLDHDSDLMNKYFNYINLYLGVCAVSFSWFLSGFFIRKYGLKVSLLATPILWGTLSFFDILASLSGQTGYSWHGVDIPLNLISLSILLSVGRAIKFTLFDTSKEMSFLSLDQKKKRSGKAAIDGLSSRFGKSGGAWLLIVITSQAGGQVIASLLPIKAVICSCYCLWFYAAITLTRSIPDEEPAVDLSSNQKHQDNPSMGYNTATSIPS